MLKLKNGDDDGIVVDSSLLEDVIAGFGAGAINTDSPKVGTSDNNDNDDIHHCHPVGQLFWVLTLESNIMTLSLSDSPDVSTVQRNFISHYYSVRGDSCIIVSGG